MLFPFYANMFVPGKTPVKEQHEIFDITSCGEYDVDSLGSVGWITVSVNQWLDHCPWLVLQYSSPKVAVIDSGEFCSAAVYSGYNNGLRERPWGTLALAEIA
jgi:hypothetical protein